MNINEYNLKAINDVYKNAHIAMQSISDLLPAITDHSLKKELWLGAKTVFMAGKS